MNIYLKVKNKIKKNRCFLDKFIQVKTHFFMIISSFNTSFSNRNFSFKNSILKQFVYNQQHILLMSWQARYFQCEQPHNMSFASLNVDAQPGGLIKGSGTDEVGQFTFEGSFSPNEPKCRIFKQYIGQHAIYYQGTLNPNTMVIDGFWGFNPGSNDGKFQMRRV